MIAGCDYLVPIELDPEADRDAWIAERLKGIGGSDAAAVVGEHPEMTPVDVWHERWTGVQSFVDNERTEMGRILEPVVLELFAAGSPRWPRSGGPLTVRKPPSCYHRDRSWQRGSPDGFVYYPEQIVSIAPGVDLIRSAYRPHAIIEIKTHGWFGAKNYAKAPAYYVPEDGPEPVISIPGDKRIQIAWYMALCDVDVAYLACLIDTHLRRTFVLHRDRELESMLIEEVDLFWRKHVLTGEPPPPDGTERYSKYLAGRFKTHTDQLVMSTPEVELAVQALVAVKRDLKRLEKDKELAAQVIKRHIGENIGVRTALGPVTWKSQPSGKLRDKDARKELYEVAGWTDTEIAVFEERYKQPDHRVLRTP